MIGAGSRGEVRDVAGLFGGGGGAETVGGGASLRQEARMLAKRTMSLNLTDAEMDALEKLARRKDLSKTAVIRQALRLYNLVDTRVMQGEKLFFEDELQGKKSELMVLG